VIDFRYHLVSIASVFLALAVGIVLGAGPLKGTISDTLTGEVTKLREDANALRADLNTAQAQVKSRDQLITELRPRTLTGLLSGQHVTILALPGAPDALDDAAREVLTEAGAATGPTISLQPSWASEEPPDVTDRGTAAAELRALLSGELPVGVEPERVLSLSLATALTGAELDPDAEEGIAVGEESLDEQVEAPADAAVGGATPDAGTGPTGETEPTSGTEPADDTATDGAEPTGSTEPTDSTATDPDDLSVPERDRAAARRAARILEILTDADLITVDGDTPPIETSAIVLLCAETVETEQVAESDQAKTPGWIDLVTVLAAARPLTLVGDVPADAPVWSNLIAAVRDNEDIAGEVASVDNLRTPIGRVSLPVIVAKQAGGNNGHYGELDTAGALFPTLPDTP